MIKNIIFDFGAVLLPIDESRSWKALEALGASEQLSKQTKLLRSYEIGKTNTHTLLKKCQPFFFRKNIFPGDIKAAWNAMLYHPLESEKVAFLRSLRRKGFKLFLLSNTNEMHIEEIRNAAGPFLYKQFLKQFDGVYYSHEVGMRKPEPKIFKKVLADHALKADECIFIDDKSENTSAAEKLKIAVWHYDPEEDDILKLPKIINKIST